MSSHNVESQARAALDAGEGIIRLAPTWVPRSFLMPGARLKLAKHDLYALGTHRGGIDERWFASTTVAAIPVFFWLLAGVFAILAPTRRAPRSEPPAPPREAAAARAAGTWTSRS